MRIGVYEGMRKRLRGFWIADCAIRSRDCIYIFFQNRERLLFDDDDEDTELLFRTGFYYPRTERVWGYDEFVNLHKGKCCVLPPPNGPAVVVDFDGHVLSHIGDTDRGSGFDLEDPIPLIRQVAVTRVREIAGQAHVAGTLRTVFRREGPGEWTCLHGNDPEFRNKHDGASLEYGFEDIDGFAADDLYACGGEGELYHYDGRHWDRIECGTNQYLGAICCAGNGKVYVGGADGMLLEGRGNRWEMIGEYTPGFSRKDWVEESAGTGADVKCMAWYRDRLYIGTDYYGIWEYADGELRRATGLSALVPDPYEEDPEPKLNERVQELLRQGGASEEAIDLVSMPMEPTGAGIPSPGGLHSLSTDGDLLVIGGAQSVVVFDGQRWKTLYSHYGSDEGGSL